MQAESRFSCCLIGQRSLLILCAEDLLARGHEIRGVATESDEIQTWATSRGVPVLPSSNDRLIQLLSEDPCDYLFSVINYRVLPDHILRLPKRGSINFHDGPLPGYAGMYVTTWALINGEREHGVSWHWMVKEIDGGGVLQDKRFPVSCDETAFTLNTKCYEAGFEAFRSLVTDLEQDTVSSRPQTGNATGGYYGLRKRPEKMATLDWSRPAEDLDALFRGLDFGRYENPIGCPKVIWGDRVLIPGRLTVLEQKSTELAGTLERPADSNAVRVHTTTKIVELAALSTLDGEPVEVASLSPNVGRSGRLDGTPPAELDRLLERICVHESFWAARLALREAVTLPYVPSDVQRDQSRTEHIRRELDGRPLDAAGDSSKFVAQAVAAISLYLGRLSGKEAFDLDYQSLSLAGLPQQAARYFATSVPLRIRLNWPGSFAEHVQYAEAAISELEKRGTYARDLVLRYPQIAQEHRQKLREIPDVAVAVLPNALDDVADLPKAQLAFLISHSERKIGLVANADVFDERILAKIAEELAHVVAQIGSNPQAVLADVAVVAPCEQTVLDRWNDVTRVDYEPLSVPRMFEAQVERSPEATAIVFRGASISYRELNLRANQLANLLIARGVKQGDLVGVLMDRSVEMVVSLYAVLKAGAAYVPMDPAYPSHRLAIMVEDAAPAVILTQASRVAQVESMKAQLVVVDRPNVLDGQSTKAPSVAIEPDDVAYLMYTSGSTGRPKGAMVTHGNIQNFFLTIDQKLGNDPPGTWLAVTSISFDISIPELFWTLSRGAQVVLRGSGKAVPPAVVTKQPDRKIDFSLFLGNAAGREQVVERVPNRLLLDAAQFAGEHGFTVCPQIQADMTNQQSTWITTDGHPDTFRCAGEIGAHTLTPLLGQSVETVAKNIALYRQVWKESGHSGEGRVTVLVPTFIGQDESAVKNAVRGPLKAYLKNDLTLVREAAWDFPTFQRMSEEAGQTLDGFLRTISDADLNELLEFAFERYYTTGGLFGTPAHCLAMVERLKEIGVDEIACLVDFGVPADEILQHLPELNELRGAANADQSDVDPDDIATLIERHGVTHFQCTPSRAASLTWDPPTRRAMGNLRLMIVGGEAMSEELARQLQSLVPGRVFNVYGPTETTVWSTMHELTVINGPVPLGKPIANTRLYVVDERQRPLPIGVPGELLIGGKGVGRGYLNRPDLTRARYLRIGDDTVYRTGDLVRLRPDGVVEFLGRFDDQVKIRGHRIELGEIEAVLESHPSIRKAVVHPQDDAAGGKRLVAYVVSKSSSGLSLDALRDFVNERLPEFMVPSLFELLKELPMTPSGKVDRRALPKPNFRSCRAGAAQQRTPPRTETERRLVELWQTLLEVRDVDRSDNFFELGGHSLLGMRAISQIHDSFDVRLSTKTFLVSSLAQVAAEIDRLSTGRQTGDDNGARPNARAAKTGRFLGWLRNRMNGEPANLAKNRE
jgi:non-ribosomal peptide synthetase component F/methionyl-tRNA formyltransferase